MNTAKKTWVSPKATLEEFTPNEYVSTCYSLSCQVGKTNNYNPDKMNFPTYSGKTEQKTHSSSGTGNCFDAASNYIVTGSDGQPTTILESNAAQGTLTGVYVGYVDVNRNGKCDAGDRVYWQTIGRDTDGNEDDRYWNHWATAQVANPLHPNRS